LTGKETSDDIDTPDDHALRSDLAFNKALGKSAQPERR
jgi:hypothetical protein